MNSFAVLSLGEHHPPVIPKFQVRDSEEDDNQYLLVGFATPLTGGARRGSRAITAYTPLYINSHPDLWGMQTKLLYAAVKTPYMGVLPFFGCECDMFPPHLLLVCSYMFYRIPCVIFRSVERPEVLYGVQNPDKNYKAHWEATMAVWAVEHARGNEEALRPWVDVDARDPRPWYVSRWAWRVLRLENGLPPTHPDDPDRSAMLGACRRAPRVKDRRAPKTEAEWRAFDLNVCDPDDDEEGSSDAGSINDDVEAGLPTSSDWDPVTKKSTTPRGTVPHPYPDVVQSQLDHIREYELRMAADRGGSSSTADREGRGGAGPSHVAPQPPRGRRLGRGRGRGQSAAATRTEEEPHGSGSFEQGEPDIAPPPTQPTNDVDMGSIHESDVDADGEDAHPPGTDHPAIDEAPVESSSSAMQGVELAVGSAQASPSGSAPNPVLRPATSNEPTRNAMAVGDAGVASTSGPPGASSAVSEPRGTGPPRRLFCPPPPGSVTVRNGPRGGQTVVREQDRGFSADVD
jgi:hypothetical protein